MSLVRRVFQNFTWLSLGEISSKIASFVTLVLLARNFSLETYGQWSWALGFTAIFAALADFGFSTLAVRELARSKEKTAKYLDNIITMKIILGFLTLGLMMIIMQFISKDPVVVKLVLFLGIYTILNTFGTFFQSVFRANEKMHYETIVRVLQSLSILGLALFFILTNGSILTISYAYITGAICGILFSLIFVWRYFSKFFVGISINTCKEILKLAWPFTLSAVTVIIYYHIDIIFLGIFKSDVDVGYYSAAYNIVVVLTMSMGLLVMSLFPMLANFYKTNIERFRTVVLDSFKFVYLLTFPLIILIFFNSQLIIKIIYGEKFVNYSDIVLQILIWSVLVLYIYAVFAIGLSASDKQKIYLRGTIIGAIFNTCTNLIAIPLYGYHGAAITTVLTEILVGSYMTYKFIKMNNIKLPFVFIFKIFLAAILTILFIYGLNFININLIIASVLGLLLYFLLIFIFRTFENSILITFKKLISK